MNLMNVPQSMQSLMILRSASEVQFERKCSPSGTFPYCDLCYTVLDEDGVMEHFCSENHLIKFLVVSFIVRFL